MGRLAGMDRQTEFVLRSMEERGIRFVRLWFTDVLGSLKSVAIAPAEVEGAIGEGGASAVERVAFDGGLFNEEEKRVLSVFRGSFPVHIDDIADESGFGLGELNGILMGLELKKAVRNLPGRNYAADARTAEFITA